MKLSSLQVGLVSVIAAVVLWLVATWFEDESRWLPAEVGDASDTQFQRPRADTPVKTGTDVLSCAQAESRMILQVQNAQVCATDDDCTLFDYGYPIQCMTSVSKYQITTLRMAYRDYEESCAYRVYYDCPSGEMQRLPVCRNNQCEVELMTSDPLEDETLQHLGIKDL